MAAGTLAGIAMTDLYADLDKSTLILIEKVEKPVEKVVKPQVATVEQKTEKLGDDLELPVPLVSLPPISISLPQPGSVSIPFVGNAGTALSMLVGVGGVEGT